MRASALSSGSCEKVAADVDVGAEAEEAAVGETSPAIDRAEGDAQADAEPEAEEEKTL